MAFMVLSRRRHHLHGARPAPHPGAVRQTRRRPAHVRRAELAPAAQDQHGGRHPADLRLVDAGLSRHDRAASSIIRGRGRRPTTSRPAAGSTTLLYVGLIIFFCYFYTAVTFNTTDVADNMKKFGGYIPGIRPGQRTAEYIDRILSRITLGGALYVSAVCVLPTILIRRFNVPFYFGGTALLIVVGVALDTVAQIETHMLTRSYQGFMKRGRIARTARLDELRDVRMILMGPPGAGKGTQAKLLAGALRGSAHLVGRSAARGGEDGRRRWECRRSATWTGVSWCPTTCLLGSDRGTPASRPTARRDSSSTAFRGRSRRRRRLTACCSSWGRSRRRHQHRGAARGAGQAPERPADLPRVRRAVPHHLRSAEQSGHLQPVQR